VYPYHLGIHLKTGEYCRVPHPAWEKGIPQGFARVIRFKIKNSFDLYQHYIYPYRKSGPNESELLPEYWSVPRWTDLKE
jgi:hypothetical protein